MMTLMLVDAQFISNIFIKTPVPSYDIFANARRPKRKEGTMDFGLGMYDNYQSDMPQKDYFISEMSNVKLPVRAENLYLNGAIPYKHGVNNMVDSNSDTEIRIVSKKDGIYLELDMSNTISAIEGKMVKSFSLEEALVPGVIFDNPDGSNILFDSDYFNDSRDDNRNSLGPLASFLLESNLLNCGQD